MPLFPETSLVLRSFLEVCPLRLLRKLIRRQVVPIIWCYSSCAYRVLWIAAHFLIVIADEDIRDELIFQEWGCVMIKEVGLGVRSRSVVTSRGAARNWQPIKHVLTRVGKQTRKRSLSVAADWDILLDRLFRWIPPHPSPFIHSPKMKAHPGCHVSNMILYYLLSWSSSYSSQYTHICQWIWRIRIFSSELYSQFSQTFACSRRQVGNLWWPLNH